MDAGSGDDDDADAADDADTAAADDYDYTPPAPRDFGRVG